MCEWIVTVIVLSTRIDLSSSGNAQLDPSMSTYIRFGRYERPISTNRKEQITKRKKIDVRRSSDLPIRILLYVSSVFAIDEHFNDQRATQYSFKISRILRIVQVPLLLFDT